ncbi:endonuclease V [Fimbriiglobus ruber]|uniref:Endonuclease V n=1 Tax=Fimbriiglobus ruber TaxID=1908690 RepID=A0A225DUC3_9BACT|nr:endonuclease V [Fimbriiglobus ruber]OWK44992.1 Endonuclease V [Fimbriiglobus ruber]
MSPTPLHDWDVSPDQAVLLQAEFAGRIDTSSTLAKFDLIAGCDIAYDLVEPVLYAAVVVVRVADLAPVETAVVRAGVKFPYVPGLLSFREVPPLLSAWESLRSEPDLVMLDGQGIAHPRRFGLACHLGLWLDRPTVGCAKTWLVGEYAEPGPTAGDAAPLSVDGVPVGAVVRSATGVRPVFVSPGHKIDVAGAVAVTRVVLGGHRHPVPTRLAHMAANQARAAGRVDPPVV